MSNDTQKVVSTIDMFGTPVRVEMSLYKNATESEKYAWNVFFAQLQEGMKMKNSFSVANDPAVPKK